MLQPNDKLGPYKLIRLLGRGGSGFVWLAERQTSLMTTLVAIKIPHHLNPDLNVIRQETQAWLQVSGHPNILPVLEADIYNGYPIIVSEYAPDGSLAVWIQRHGGRAPSVQSAVVLMAGILAGLEHLHNRRIVHRDLKPENILLQGENPRLTDFGISRVLDTTSQTKHTAGTPTYMPPEAFDGRYSPQSDLWAAGVVIYELLAGRLPFVGPDINALFGAIMRREPEPLSNTVPAKLRQVVTRALQKDPAKRYRTAAEMRTDLLTAFPNAFNAPSVQPGRVPSEEGRQRLMIGAGIGTAGFALLGLLAWMFSGNTGGNGAMGVGSTPPPSVPDAGKPKAAEPATAGTAGKSQTPPTITRNVCTKTGLAPTKFCPHLESRAFPADAAALKTCTEHTGPTCSKCGRVFAIGTRYCPYETSVVHLTGTEEKGNSERASNPARHAVSPNVNPGD